MGIYYNEMVLFYHMHHTVLVMSHPNLES